MISLSGKYNIEKIKRKTFSFEQNPNFIVRISTPGHQILDTGEISK